MVGHSSSCVLGVLCLLVAGCVFDTLPLHARCPPERECSPTETCVRAAECTTSFEPRIDAGSSLVPPAEAPPDAGSSRSEPDAARPLAPRPAPPATPPVPSPAPAPAPSPEAGPPNIDAASCVGAACNACPEGTERCGTECIDLRSNPKHCGACGSRCPTGEQISATCESAQCVFTCEEAHTLCHGECVSDLLLVGPDNCDAVTAIREFVRLMPCAESETLCDGVCTDLSIDAAHCGTCDSYCVAPAQCQASRCVLD